RAVLHLARAAGAPNLQHRLEVEGPALHLGLGQMATRCIGRISRAKREMTFRRERPALALVAITETLEREEHSRGEVVVDHESRYVVVARSGRAEARGRRLAHGLTPEVVGRKSRGRESRCHAATAHVDGRLGEVARSLAGSEDQRYTAVVDETIVEQMQRLADVAGRVIVGEGEGSAHHGRGIERRVVTKRLRDGAELIRSRPVKVHMAAGHQCMECTGRGHAVGKPLPAAAAAVGVACPAVTISARAAVVAVDDGYDRSEPIADERGGWFAGNAGEAALTGGWAYVRRVQSRDLAEALIVGNAVDNQSIDILETKAGIGQRLLQRPQTKFIGIIFR